MLNAKLCRRRQMLANNSERGKRNEMKLEIINAKC